MKLRHSIAAASLLLSVSAFASQTYDLKKGWNLVGSLEDSVTASTTFSTANSVWKYGEGWSAVSPNGSITASLTSASLLDASLTLNAGEGFWINVDADGTATANGTAATDTSLDISKSGWHLLSLKSDSELDVAATFKNNDKITTVWKYEGGWKAYSPQDNLAATLAGANISVLETIKPGEGFWVNASGAADDLATPPSLSAAYALLEKNNAVPLAEATVWKCNGDGTNTKIGMTSKAGVFTVDGYADGTKIVITKSGYAPAFGVIKNGTAQLMTQEMSPVKVPFESVSATSGKPISKVLNSGDGKIQLAVDNMTLNEDVTVAISTFLSPSSAPKLNDITNGDSESVTADEMMIIGGAHITVEDADGETKFNVDGSFEASVKQSTILSDLDLILNGQNEVPSDSFKKLASDTMTQINQAIADDIIELYTLVFKNGEWTYVGEAEIKSYTKVYKQKEYTKYRLETKDGTNLTSFDTFAFVMKLNALKGDLTVNVKEGGYQMFDGSIVTKEQSDTSDFDWINDNISEVTAFGDATITSGIDMTNTDGNVTMTYKVPFLTPVSTLSFKKEGYYDTTVTCTMSPAGAECPNVTMYKIPDTATVKGYVYEKVNDVETTNGIDSALVTLVNPEVLSADKIKTSVDENGTASVEVGYSANVNYTWTAMKDGSSITLKEGKGEDYTKLSEDEIYTIVVDDYNDGSVPSTYPENPAGNWTLTVKAEHTFSNDKSMTEQAVGSFSLDLNVEKLAAKLSGALNEGSISYYDGLGYKANLPALYDTSVYGGIQTGFLYAVGGKDDYNAWETYILGDGGNDLDGDLKSDDYNATGTTDPLTCIDDPDAESINKCYYNVAGETLVYDNSLFPAGYVISYVSSNFGKLLKEDPASVGENFLSSGFTITTRYKGVVIAPDSMISDDSELKGTENEHNVTVRVSSYIDLQEGVGEVKEMLDVPSISLVGESATAYLRQVVTDTDGSYAINMIPPQLELNSETSEYDKVFTDLKIFAKAEGYVFGKNPDIKLIDDLTVGMVKDVNLYLVPSEVTPNEPAPISTDFTDWTIASCDTNTDVNWNKLVDITDVTVSGYVKDTVYEGADITLLSDLDSNGYLWFGNMNNGMFTDKDTNYSTGKTCGSVTSPAFDLADYSFPTLDFKTWFEVESADIAKGMFDQMEVGFVLDDTAGTDPVTIVAIDGSENTLTPGQYYKLDLLNPDYEPTTQSWKDPYYSGFATGEFGEPSWIDVTLPVEQLAGQKVKFVFTFNSKDSLYNGYRGWGVDAVSVKESLKDNLEFPPTVPNVNDTGAAAETAKILGKVVR